MIAVTEVNASGSALAPGTIASGEQIYFKATFTAENLPDNASYRIRFLTNVSTDDPFYTKYINDGAGGFPDEIYTYTIMGGPFTAQFGPQGETVTATVNPDGAAQLNETTFTDNFQSDTFYPYGPPSQLKITPSTSEPPSEVTAGQDFSLTATVEDLFGNQVMNDSGPVTVALMAPYPAGSVLGGTTTVMASGGSALFRDLTLNKVTSTSGETLSISREEGTTGVAPTTTTPIVVLPGKTTQLAITQQPDPTSVAGIYFSTIEVATEDADGNVETGDNSTKVTAMLASGAGTLLGSTNATVDQGVASFSTLSDQTAGPVTIVFDGGGLPQVTSNIITIGPTLASQLVIKTEPSSTATVGQPFSTPAVIMEEDQYGNLEIHDNSTTIKASPGSGVGPFGGASAVVSGGVATFANLVDMKAETTTIKFSSIPLSSATSTPVVVGKATPTINWSPAVLPLGTGVGPAQLDATAINYGATVAGTYAYSVTSGKMLALGTYQVSVTFTPNDTSDYTTATQTATITVLPATTTALVVPVSTITYSQSITLSAAVFATLGGATPTGSVTFLDGSSILKSVNLDGTGHATYTTSSLPPTTRSITVVYSGDPNYAPSVSSTAPLTVKAIPSGDYNGDGKTDVAVFDPTTATFYIAGTNGVTRVQQFGDPAHVNIPVVGDFDGDGKDDIAIYDETTATFAALGSGGTSTVLQFGDPAHVNIPLTGDYNGDGKTNIGIYDQTTATFAILEPNGTVRVQPFGDPSHVNVPVAGDFDGTGITNIAIYDRTTATFAILEPNGTVRVQQLGSPDDIPIAADFDGDGRTDFAVYDQSAGQLLAIESGGSLINRQFGNPADVNIPIVGDYDGDGKSDIAVYDQTATVFLIIESTGPGVFLPFGIKKHANIPL